MSRAGAGRAGTGGAGAGRAGAGGTVRVPGVAVAGATAVVSGVSVFVNSHGVHAVPDPAVYTTGKNLVAAVLLLAVAAVARRARPDAVRATADRAGRGPVGSRAGILHLLALAYVGVVGGGVAFVLFFQGLAATAAEPAAFLHDTMVLWVLLLAVPFLRERPSGWNLAAVLLLVGGQVAVTGGLGNLVAGHGPALVLEATVLWAVETVVARRLLATMAPATLGLVRMGVGAVVLVGYVTATGHLGTLLGLDRAQLGWVTLTGGLLAVYVATWMVALSRARALDVTSVLVASVLVTALLQAVAGHPGSWDEVAGLVLVVAGTGAVLWAWPRPVVAT